MNVVHWNLLLPFGSNVEDSENEESQQDIDGPSDCIQAVSEDIVAEIKVVSTDPGPEGEGDAVCVKYAQTVYEPRYWVNISILAPKV